MGVAVLDDVDAARERAALGGGVDYRGEPLPHAGADPGEDDGGELLAGAGDEATADGGGSVVDDVDAGRAPLVQNGLEGGDGRGPLRVVLLPERLPVAGEMPEHVVGPVDHDHQPRHTVKVAVEGDAALQLGAEADQGVVDAGDVAAVRDRRQVLRPQVGDAGVVEDQGVAALVEELRGGGGGGPGTEARPVADQRGAGGGGAGRAGDG
ncbi:hypothetical protein [Streptomyces sp. NPDC093984]|uniref:hypothetical protein n=1 Tax=Streptomyces sp. NPDC093984 TaxID=3366052 RepID=UPI003818BC37